MNKQQEEGISKALRDSEFVVLTTYRRDGTPVPTTVWHATDGNGNLYVQTLRGAGKLKRIAHTSRVMLTPSDARGKTYGETLVGAARVIEGAEAEVAEETLQNKYGIKRTGFLLAMGAHNKDKRGYLVVRIPTDGASS